MIDGNTLSAAGGAVLSLAFSYVPYVKVWFKRQAPRRKRLVMGVLIVVLGVGAALTSCGDVSLAECIPGIDFGAYLSAILAALVTNQTTYQLSTASSKK